MHYRLFLFTFLWLLPSLAFAGALPPQPELIPASGILGLKCTFQNQCPQGQVCAGGYCRTRCAGNGRGQCLATQQCRGGFCTMSCNFVTGELHFECIPMYIGYLIELIFGFTAGMCLLEIIHAGYEMSFSGFGDRESSRKRIWNALLGLAMAVMAFLIVDTILTVLLSGPPS